MTNNFFITLMILILGGFAVTIWLLRRPKKEDVHLKLVSDWMQGALKEITETRREMQERLSQNTSELQQQIFKTNQLIGERLDNAAKVIGNVSKELGEVQEMGRQMKELQEFLRSPKLRGNIGEQVLRDLLEQYFPREHFALQYKFREGEIADAILKTDKGIIAIDSKFPFENFRRMIKTETELEKKTFEKEFRKDVKKHIHAISTKYIVPSEGTVDFAVMYVPSEAVYYEIMLSQDDLINYGHQKKVLVVSPNSFFYFLKVIMMAMEGKRIEEAAQQIREILIAIKTDSDKFSGQLATLTIHITNAKSAVDRVNNEYAKLSSKIEQVKLLK